MYKPSLGSADDQTRGFMPTRQATGLSPLPPFLFTYAFTLMQKHGSHLKGPKREFIVEFWISNHGPITQNCVHMRQ